MTATVQLKEGQTYRYRGRGGEYVFTRGTPGQVSDPEDIRYLQTVGCLLVRVHEPAPAPAAEPVVPEQPAGAGEAPSGGGTSGSKRTLRRQGADEPRS